MNPDRAGMLLTLVVAWPLLAALAAAVIARAGCSRRWFDLFVTVSAGIALAGVVALIAPVLAESRIAARVPLWVGPAEFVADPIGLTFALIAALVWFCATLYATAWLREDAGGDTARVRYQVTSLVLLAANLGVVLAGNLMTLYVCFEILGLGALLVVIHDGSRKARRAGIKYFWMTLGGGISLLAGIFLLQGLTGSGELGPLPADVGNSPALWAAFGLLLVGFGVKAGMVPLHVWLPDAHPVAPPPASALLSGVMIKVGAYGIFRCLNVLFTGESADMWAVTARMGLVVMWLGLLTMLVGAVLALGQQQAKRLLAWSSVSQMGFVLTGIGAGAYLGREGAMASAGGLLHVVNHGLFKGALFLGVGAVAMRAGTADMDRLGGLWRRMPITFAAMLVATAGVTGVPLFNGFVSKSMIHHGLVAAGDLGNSWLPVAEWIFLAGSAGTLAYFLKLIALVFLRKPDRDWDHSVREAPWAMLTAMLLLVMPIVVIGIRPQWLLQELIAPGLSALAVPTEPVAYYLSHYFLGAGDFRSFAGVAISGIGLFAAGMRYGLFKFRAPSWVGVDYWYRAAGRGFVAFCHWLGAASERIRDVVRVQLFDAMSRLNSRLKWPRRAPGRDRDRDFERLDRLRDRVRSKAGALARARSDDTTAPEREHLVNDARWIAGLLGTRVLERAIASFAGVAGRDVIDDWLSKAEERAEDLAGSSLELAAAWRKESGFGETELQKVLERLLPPLPAPVDIGVASPGSSWRAELKALVFRPGQHRWPVTDGLDRGRMSATARRFLHRIAGDLSVALTVVFALLTFLLFRTAV